MNKFRFSYLARRLAMLAGRPATFFAAVRRSFFGR